MPSLLSATDREEAKQAMVDIIETTGKKHRLIYANIQTNCPNCTFDPISGKSTGRYKTGGPRPFPNGTICPVCRGAGKLASEASEEIIMTMEYNPKSYTTVAPALQIPNGIVLTVGYIADLPKVLRATTLLLDIELDGYMQRRFRLQGEPFDDFSITPHEFFSAYWIAEGNK